MLVKAKYRAFQNGIYLREGDVIDIELPLDQKTKKPKMPQWAEAVPVNSAAVDALPDTDVLS